MPILVSCPCGKQYRVADDAGGKKIKCKYCETIVRVPDPTPEPLQNETRVDGLDDLMQQDLQRIREATDSAASNPGMLRVDRLRYVRAFPFWAAVWHLPLLMFALLTIVHWAFIFPAFVFAAAAYLYWRRIKYNFIAGCVNPGIVLSKSPPRIAVLTNLTKGGGDWNVIKVLSHPLHRMSTGMPAVGQRVATIAGYFSSNEDLPHWDDFEPVVPDVVSADRSELKRLTKSVSDDDWQKLDERLKQLPGKPLNEGLYRVYNFDSLKPYVRKSDTQVAEMVRNALASCRMTQFAIGGIEQSLRHKASTYIAPSDMPKLLAITESASLASGGTQGFAITPTHLYFNFDDTGNGHFAFSQLAGAMITPAGVEITLRDRSRRVFSNKHVSIRTRLGLEILLTELIETDY